MGDFRRRLMMQVASDPNALPVGCVRCEYLQSTGAAAGVAQYIDVGMVNSQDVIRIDFMITGVACFGYRWGGASSGTNHITASSISGAGVISYGQPMTKGNYKLNTRYDVIFDPIKEVCTVNGEELIGEYSPKDAYNAQGSSQFPFFLFALNKYGGIVYGSAKIFSFSILTNSELRLNLIPCLDQNGKPCMYDTVAKKFYYNKGAGTFLYKIAE